MYVLAVGVVVLVASGYVALNIADVAEGIRNLSSNVKASDRGPTPLDWQPKTDARQARLLAWLLVLASTVIGIVFVVLGVRSI